MSDLSDAERAEFRSDVRRFLESRSPESAVRSTMDTALGFDRKLWREMSEKLGLQAIAIPEEFGGSGFTFEEAGIVIEEMGRALLCAPYLSSVVLAANALLLSKDSGACRDYLPAIANSSLIATLAISEDFMNWEPESVRMQAVREDGLWRLTGSKTLVLDGIAADLLLVLARSEAGASLFAVDGDDPGLTRTALDTLDLTRKLAKLDFERVAGRLVGREGEGTEAVSRTLDIMSAALSVEAVGGAERCLEMAVEYAKTRVQFGKPIGAFQAIQHKCAELVVELELAKSAAHAAVADSVASSENLRLAAPMAKAFCADTYCRIATDNIQIHGGMGFTWDHPAHLFYRRARATQLMLGDGAYHREQLAQRAGL